jgi:hypothetical protein
MEPGDLTTWREAAASAQPPNMRPTTMTNLSRLFTANLRQS